MTILQQLKNGKKIVVKSYSINYKIEKIIKDVLTSILKEYNVADLTTPIYTCLKELLINAIKANYKKIFLLENPHLINSSEYLTLVKEFKDEITGQSNNRFEKVSRDENLSADVVYQLKDDVLHISIKNPVQITTQEFSIINRKIKDAHSCKNIADYFIQHADDPENEGAGIGIILIYMMMRSLGLGDNNFMITSENNITTATLIYPLKSLTKQ